MFTGLVQDVGELVSLERRGMTELWIKTSLGASEFALGESIAVNGACLTVVERKGDLFRVQASEETLRRTSMGGWKKGERLNLERAMRLQDRLGGHLVLGHVDAVGELVAEGREGDARICHFSLPPELSLFFIEKGSVTVDGVSLTVNTLSAQSFSVALIPETQVRTTLGTLRAGQKVNLEADLIGKYVARLHGARAGAGLSEATLRRAGFGETP